MPSNHLILCRTLLLPPSIFPSIRIFSNKSVLCIRWPKYWSFSFSISPSNEYSVLISFMMDWLDSLLSKELSRVFSNTTVQKHQFFGAQLSLQSDCHIHTRLLENHSFDQTDLSWQSNVSTFQYAIQVGHSFSSKEQVSFKISWLQSPSAVILKPPNIKSLTVSVVSASICHEVMGPDAMIVVC